MNLSFYTEHEQSGHAIIMNKENGIIGLIDEYGNEGSVGDYATIQEAKKAVEEMLNDYDAESFEAECSICNTQVRTMSEAAWIDGDGCVCIECMDFDEDFQGKPYTGKINPNDPDFDAVKADRNKDNKLSSWERAVGNQVARSMRMRKGGKRPSSKRTFAKKESSKRGLFGSITPMLILGIGAAYIAGKEYLKE